MGRKSGVVVLVAVGFCHLLSTTRAAGDLIPRTPLPKPATITKPVYESRLKVKFRDDSKVRLVSGSLTSLTGAEPGRRCLLLRRTRGSF